MRKNFKLLGAVAVAGVVATTGSAFTGGGVKMDAAGTQFVGGTVSQAITGAELDNVAYTYSGSDKYTVNTITLTTTGAVGKTVTVTVTAATGSVSDSACTPGTTETHVFTCSGLTASGVSNVAVTVA